MRSTTLFLIVVSFTFTVHASEIGVRIRFGITDKTSTVWDGTATVSPGKIVHIDGWRFQQRDEVLSNKGWKASTRTMTVRRSNNPKKAGGGANKKASALMADNGVILLLEEVTENSILKIKTAPGNFEVKLSEIP